MIAAFVTGITIAYIAVTGVHLTRLKSDGSGIGARPIETRLIVPDAARRAA
jgi:hypothetical protein